MEQLLDLRIESTAFLGALYAAAGAVLLVLLVLVLRSGSRRRAASVAAIVAGGALVGLCLAWVLSDVIDLFGISLSGPTRAWAAALFAGVALVIAGFVFLGGPRRILAALALPLCVLAAAAGINADFGQFPTLRVALGLPAYGALAADTTASLPAHGSVGTVDIPASVSGFSARPAMVYLPPVARTPHPPVLPVIEALSGQPGSPQDPFTAGRLAAMLDAWAAGHAGVAPIVVVPDQLGAPNRNPMCVDSPLGNSATYLTVDVPAWIRAHFRVAPGPSGWAIAGFSQGGTCSIQLGAAHPELYGTVFDISGELQPRAGSPADTLKTGFGGSQAAYTAASPTAILAAHAPYRALHVIFAAGSNDVSYLAWAYTLADAAGRAGADTQVLVSPGTGHDWHTVRYAWKAALPILARDLGLAASG
jgi:enterochelin esterase-like enzyme